MIDTEISPLVFDSSKDLKSWGCTGRCQELGSQWMFGMQVVINLTTWVINCGTQVEHHQKARTGSETATRRGMCRRAVDSGLCHQLAKWPWVIYFTFLKLSFLICKIGEKNSNYQILPVNHLDTWYGTCKCFLWPMNATSHCNDYQTVPPELSGSRLLSLFIHLEHGWEINRKQKTGIARQRSPHSLFRHNYSSLDHLLPKP